MADFLLSVGVDVGLSYTEMQKDISTLVSKLNSNPPKIKVAFDIDDKAISNLRTQIAEISKALGTSGAAVKAGSGTSSTASVNAQIRQRINLENEAKQAATSAAAAKKLADDQAMKSELSRQALLKKSYTLLTQMQNAENKWTAAKTGKSSSAYTAIQSDIASLQQWNMQFKSGQMTADEFSAKLSSLSSSFTTNSNTIKAAGEATQTWSQRLGGLSAKFGTWFSITRVIMAAYRALRQMVSAVIDVDTAMTELKKVTDETDAVYDKFLDNAARRAKELGAALSDVVTASADFARLGFNIGEAEELADAAIVYKNVGDGIENISDASESIIATMQAFGIEATEVMTIVDKFNEVGNNYAISSKGVGDALLRSAAAMHSANNTLDETIALATASNTIVQDPEKVGTTLKTVSMYLRAAKTEADEAGESTEGMANSVSELRNEILSLTGNKVDIQIDDDTFKSTYQILQELSKVWHELSDVSQANILEMVGGKRNSNVVAAILENFSVAEKALETSMSAAGSALEENEKYLDSINGKISVFKASFEDFSTNLISSDLVKDIVGLGTGLINVLNTVAKIVDVLGGLNTILYTTLSIIVTIKAQAIITGVLNFFNGFAATILTLGTTLKKVGSALKVFIAMTQASRNANAGAMMVYGQSTGVLGRLSAAFNAVGISASTAQIAVAAFMIVLTALILVIQSVNKAQEEAEQKAAEVRQQNIQAAQAAATYSDELSTLINRFIELNDVVGVNNNNLEQFIQTRADLIEKLQLEEDELDTLIAKYGSYSDAVKQATVDKLRDQERDLRGGIGSYEDELLKAAEVTYHNIMGTSAQAPDNNLISYLGVLDEKIAEGTEVYKAIEALENSSDFRAWAKNKAFGFGIEGMTIDDLDTVEGVLKAYDKLGEALDLVADKAGSDNEVYKQLYSQYSSVTEAINNYRGSIGNLNKNLAEQYMLNGLIGKEVPATKEEFDAYKQSVIDAAKNSGEFIGTEKDISVAIDNVLSKQPQFMKFYADLIEETDNATTSTNKFVSALSKINSLDTGLSELDKIYADIFDKGDFDWSSILDNEAFTTAFSGLGDAYTDFIETVANSPTDLNACQEAFNNLASAYIMNSSALKGVTDETRDATVAMLKQMGVANAAAIVDAQLAYNKEYLKYTTGDYATKTYEEIVALYNECEAGSVTQQVLAELAIAKMMANENAIQTASDIDQLIALANSANATTQSLANLAKAKEMFTKADALYTQSETTRQNYIKNGNQADGREWQRLFAEASSLRSQAEELLNTPIEYNTIDADKFKVKYTGGSSTSSAKSSAAKAAEKAAKDQETWFEKQLAEHQHLVAMEQETEAEYLAWLSKAYPQAYQEGIIELKDFYKYQEEVFEGLRDLFKDKLGDIEHEISMRENYEGEEKKIISLYKGLMSDVEKEIAKARTQGLTDEDDYIQELQEKWQDYANAIKDIREEIEEAAKDALDEMIDYRVDMLKQEIEDEKDALDKKLDNLKEFYDKQKEMLQDKYDEEKYLEDQAEKRKSVSDIKGELAMLENDDSAWAQKRKLELTEELTDAEKDLADFEKENALDKALDAIDEAYNSQEAQLQREMDALDEKLNDPNALFNQALEDIKNNSKNQLYYQMLMYNRQYGDGNDETVKKLWEDTYGALNDYEKLFGKLYKGVDLKNETGVKDDKGWDDEKVSGTNPDNKPKDPPKTTTTTTTTQSTAPSLSSGSTVTIKKTATHFGSKSKGVKMASFVPGGSYTVYQTSGNQVLIGRNGVYTGWVNKSDIVGYASGTKHATAGLHELFEQGDEYIFSASDGSRYRMFSGGEKVLNAKATEFLYDFANSGGDVLAQMLKNVFGGTGLDGITPTVINNEINMGDIIVRGSADTKTVSEIRRAQRESVDFMLKEFTKLNK